MEPGDRIDGWIVESRLGAGGMGSVYRCRSAATDRIVAAIKVLEASLRQSAEAEQRFVREAAIVAGLDHPNIVRVRNVRTEARPPYIEMDFVEGRSLDDLFRRGPLPYAVARRYLLQVADALAYLHGRGVRHRDLKPANLLVDAQDRIKIVDFGLATDASMDRITEEGVNFGTVSYAPPEWMDPERLDPAMWDLYAVGVILHEVLTGEVAFPMSGEGPIKKQLLQVMLRKQSAPPLDPGPSFPREVRELVADLTCLELEDRVPDAAALLSRARALPAEATVPLPSRREPSAPPPPVEPDEESRSVTGAQSLVLTLPPRRTRIAGVLTAFGLSLLGAALLVGGVGLATLEPRRPARPAQPVPLPLPVASGGRHVEVTFLGVPEGVPVRARLDGREVGAVGGLAVFDAVSTAEALVTWVAGGAACDPCPGEACPAFCGSGELPLLEGADDVKLAVPTGGGRGRVVVSVPDVANKKKKRWTMSARLDGHPMAASGAAGAVMTDVLPGRHRLVVDVGTCPAEAAGCWPSGHCPDRCRSVAREVVVPWSGGTVPARFDLEPD